MIRELKLEGVNHDRMKKMGRNCVQKAQIFMPQREMDTTSSPFPEFHQSQERHIFK
jgi:hypothetical protein